MGTQTGAPASPAGRARGTARILVVCAVGLTVWIGYLASTLTQDRYVVRRWGVAWVGLDVAEAVALLVTALLVRRRSPAAAPVAAATSTLFLVDAWFDTGTSREGLDYAVALVLAILGELPLGIYCAVVATRATRWFTRPGG
jgi:hypothetical protein